MSSAAARLPGLYYTRVASSPEPSPLRSDVAAFAGRTRRGPIGEAVRVEGWREYLRAFGGLDASAWTPYAVRGYFENGGQVAYVVRLAGSRSGEKSGEKCSSAVAMWATRIPDISTGIAGAVADGFAHAEYRVEATSPGAWSNRTRITIKYRRRGVAGRPEVDFVVEAPDEPVEILSGLVLERSGHDDDPLQEQVARRSQFIRVIPTSPQMQPAEGGPNQLGWRLELASGMDGQPSDGTEYTAAMAKLNDIPEIALLCLPDLHAHPEALEATEQLKELVVRADALRDRLVLVDIPPGSGSVEQNDDEVIEWIKHLREDPPQAEFRSAAVYHPWVEVPDPLGGFARPLKRIPPCGHVAGVISRLDRELGAHHTPANARMFDAVDLAQRLEPDVQIRLYAGAVNLLRCMPGRGLHLWGGSTLTRQQTGDPGAQAMIADHFIAYRRLIHRLVRAIRRVAEPLVFDTNGPELWLTFVRAVTTVLLEAYRSGALKGARPEEAFRVRCDERTNPPDETDQGRCVCEIAIAPVAPMEFIVLRVALGSAGTLDVFET